MARIEDDGEPLYEMRRGRPLDARDMPERVELALQRVSQRVPAGPVTGTVSWPRHRDLPPAAVLRVELWDAARGRDRQGRLVQHELTHFGRPPVSFRLAYDRRDIDPERDYVVLARIVVRGRVILRTRGTHGVITKGRPTRVEISLESAG
jgi:uncharacterized lipoprotein YbaY